MRSIYLIRKNQIKYQIKLVKNVLTRLFHCNLYKIVFTLLCFYNIIYLYIIINNDRHANDYTYRGILGNNIFNLRSCNILLPIFAILASII